MPQNPSDDKSTLVQVMAWCRQAASHYLSQCCPRSLSPYGVTRPQWVNWSNVDSSSACPVITSTPLIRMNWLINSTCAGSYVKCGANVQGIIYTREGWFRLAPSQWETSLQRNAFPYWLGTNAESALYSGHGLLRTQNLVKKNSETSNDPSSNSTANCFNKARPQINQDCWSGASLTLSRINISFRHKLGVRVDKFESWRQLIPLLVSGRVLY